jgi:hypothetical protein
VKSVVRQPFDFIFADLKVFHTRVLVCVIYCSPGVDGYPYYGPVLAELSNRYPRHMIMDDFNVNLLGDSTSSRGFVEQLAVLNLRVVNMVEPTHFLSGSIPSLLDLFFN